jgi:hypothetical protein
MNVLGWLAANASQGVLSDKTYVVLTDATGNRRFWLVRNSPRPDVATAFRHPILIDAGFSATIDLGNLRGRHELSLAWEHGGALQQCSDIAVVVSIGLPN